MDMITGLSAFPVTPSDGEGRIDTAGLQRLLGRLVDAGVDSIGLLGSTGFYPYFTRAERLRAIEAAVECVAGRVPLLVGVGALRTDDTLDLVRDAAQAGADAGLLAPVSYLPLTDEEVYTHFHAATEASGLPLVIYNNPGTTHFSFGPALVERLATLPGVVAVKNPAPADVGADLADLRARVPDTFSLGYSVDLNAPAALLAGADAWYSVLGGTFPRTCLRLARAAQANDGAEVRRRIDHLEPLWALVRRHTSIRLVYAACRTMGIDGARPVRPVLPLDAAAEAELQQLIDALELD